MTKLLTRSASALFLSAAVITLTGCAPEFAPTNYGKTEENWKSKIQQSYGDWTPPPPPPPLRGASASGGPAVDYQNLSEAPASGPVVVDTPAIEPGETISVDVKETFPAASVEVPEAAPVKEEPVVEVTEPVKDIPADGKDLAASTKAQVKAAVVAPDANGKDIDQFQEYVVQPGDSLWSISKRIYKKGGKAGVIYELNKNVIPNKNRLKAGTKLKIPTP